MAIKSKKKKESIIVHQIIIHPTVKTNHNILQKLIIYKSVIINHPRVYVSVIEMVYKGLSSIGDNFSLFSSYSLGLFLLFYRHTDFFE